MNNNSKILWIAIIVVAVLVVLFVVRKKESAPQTEETVTTEPAVTTPASDVVEPDPEPEVDLPPAEPDEDVIEEELPAVETPAAETIETVPETEGGPTVLRGDNFGIKSDMVLASVNNTEITLKDLMPINKTTPVEKRVDATEFRVLLERAIDREVVLQTARQRNVQLEQPQRSIVEKSRLRAAAQGFTLPDNERQAHEDKSNFESLDLLATLLTDALAKTAGGPPKDETPEEEYQQYVRTMLDELRGKNNVSQNVVIENE